jgi:hypothetical protein
LWAKSPDCLRNGIPAMGFADANDSILTDDFHNSAQRIRSVQPVRAAKRRIGDGNGMNAKVNDFHE